MAFIPLPNGAQIAIATTFGAAVSISAISNAKPAVASSVANGLSSGDVVLLSIPGWVNADNQVHRVLAGADVDEFNLPGLDASSLIRYPAGAAAGSAREITGWTQVTKVPTFERTGGDVKSMTTGYLDHEKDVELFTGTNPERLNFTVSYQPDSPQHSSLLAASNSGEMQVIRLVMKDGATLYYPGQIHFNPAPTTTKDQEMVNNVALALQGDFTRFAKYVP